MTTEAPPSRRDDATRAAKEKEIFAAHQAGDFHLAATRLLEAYGGEIGGFLAASLRDATDAADAFSMFQEDLWRGLPQFEWRASARTWAYTLARHAAVRVRRPAYRRKERPADVMQSELANAMVAKVRTTTAVFLKTEKKDVIRALRAQLTPFERELLVLRIDRGLSWAELAQVLPSDGSDEKAEAPPNQVGAQARSKRQAALRKRFERTKEKLRALADEAGLLNG